jgi:hypothetical protein
MGDVNQYHWFTNQQNNFNGPFLEVGSRDYGSKQDLRSLFPNETYIGVYKWLLGYRYLLAPTMINMIGLKPPEHS